MIALHKDSAAPQRDGQGEGEKRKANAIAQVAAHRGPAIHESRHAFSAVLLATGLATADEIRDLVEATPWIDPKCYGSVQLTFTRVNIIRSRGTAGCRLTRSAGLLLKRSRQLLMVGPASELALGKAIPAETTIASVLCTQPFR